MHKNDTCQEHQQHSAGFHNRLVGEFDKWFLNDNSFTEATLELIALVSKKPLVRIGKKLHKAPSNYHYPRYKRDIDRLYRFYKEQYTMAKKKGCDLSKFKENPAITIAKKIKKLSRK